MCVNKKRQTTYVMCDQNLTKKDWFIQLEKIKAICILLQASSNMDTLYVRYPGIIESSKNFLEKTINDRTPSIGYRNAIGENWGVWKLLENIEDRAHAVYIKSAGNQINSIAWQ